MLQFGFSALSGTATGALARGLTDPGRREIAEIMRGGRDEDERGLEESEAIDATWSSLDQRLQPDSCNLICVSEQTSHAGDMHIDRTHLTAVVNRYQSRSGSIQFRYRRVISEDPVHK